jgi:hypothetical protein
MDSTRSNVRALAEWVAAAALLAGVVAGGSIAVREFRAVASAMPSAVMPAIAREAVAQVPTGSVPDGAVSVPVLLLADELEVRVGDAAADVLRRLARAVEAATPSAERGPNGVRQTRVLDYAGTQFVLVLEPFAQDAEPRVAAIYLR